MPQPRHIYASTQHRRGRRWRRRRTSHVLRITGMLAALLIAGELIRSLV
jgi:hypothetical protein